jgi:iron complex outermembrane receptor protein
MFALGFGPACAPVIGAETSATEAAQSGEVVGTESPSNSLEEIVVTAQRRSEDLSKTPVAISVLGSDALAKQQITSQSDLQAAVPGLTVRATSNSNQLNYSIRGQSLDAYSNSEPGVLPYVNDVQIGGAGGSTAFYDLQSVQVLKGPQGTLFGRNATGGAVLFTTNKPTNDLSGYFSASVGDYRLKQFEGALSGPIVSDALLGRVAAFYQKENGFQNNLYDGSTVGDIDRYGIRGSLTAKVGDNFRSDLVGDYFHSGGTSLSEVLYNINPDGLIPASFLASPAVDSLAPGLWQAYLASHPRAFPGGLTAFLAVQRANGPFTIDVDGSNSHQANNLEISDTSSLTLADDTTLRNIAGFNGLRSVDFAELDGSPYGIVDNGPLGLAGTAPYPGQTNKTREISEELQLVGKTLQKNLSYVGGLYVEDEKIEDTDEVEILNLPPITEPSITHHVAELRNKTDAIYAEGTYNLGEWTGVQGLSVTTGGRYSIERHTIRFLPGDVNSDTPESPTFQKYQENEDHETSWHFGVQEQLNSDLLLYVTTRKSFRDGGYNWEYSPQVGTGATGGNRFLPETARDVELGTKFQGSIASLPTRLDFAVYSMTIDGVQRADYVDIDGNIAAITVNVPQAKVQGFDVDGQVNPLSWLKFGASLAYADARFTKNVAYVVGNPPTAFGPYPDTPRWSGLLFSEMSFPIQANLALTIHGDIYDQTGTYISSTYNTISPGTSITGYSVSNFRVSLDAKKGWSVAANVKNAFDRVYYAGGLGSGNLTGSNMVVPGAPRTFSITARYDF